MNDESRKSKTQKAKETADGFGMGFLSAVVMVSVLAIAIRVSEWASSHPLPEAAITLVNKPMFSIADLAQVGMLLLVACLMLWMAAYGPRIR